MIYKDGALAKISFDDDTMHWINRMDLLKSEFNNLEKITDKWGYIRQLYMEMLPYILEKAKTDIITIINPYALDWEFSPIEEDAWMSIRSHYMALYPQFPLFNHFVDFANPVLRIGLEMDGKDFHDAKKDAARDAILWRFGWRIFRIPGKQCYVKFKDQYEIATDDSYTHDDYSVHPDTEHWIMNTSDGVIYAIKQVYFLKNTDGKHYQLCCDTLEAHKGAEFPLTDEDLI